MCEFHVFRLHVQSAQRFCRDALPILNGKCTSLRARYNAERVYFWRGASFAASERCDCAVAAWKRDGENGKQQLLNVLQEQRHARLPGRHSLRPVLLWFVFGAIDLCFGVKCLCAQFTVLLDFVI